MKIGYYHGVPEQGVNLVEVFKLNEESKNPEAFDPNFQSFSVHDIRISLNQNTLYPLKKITINDTQITISPPSEQNYCYESPSGFDIYNLSLNFQLYSERNESIDILYYFD